MSIFIHVLMFEATNGLHSICNIFVILVSPDTVSQDNFIYGSIKCSGYNSSYEIKYLAER